MGILEKIKNCKVEWRKLWEITYWDKKFNNVENYKQPKTIKYKYLLAKEIKDLIVNNGNVKILTTNISDLWTNESIAKEYIAEGDVIAIPWGGNPIVQYYKGKFVTSDNRIATSRDKDYLNNKYLYYFLLNNLEIIKTYYRGSGIKHPDMCQVLELQIPIPPLDVQKEIVRILDKFIELNTELNTELNMRKKQYKYYLNKLLTFGDEVEWKKLGEVLQPKGYIRGPFGSALKKAFFIEEGIPIYEQQHAIYDKREFRYFIDKKRAENLKRFFVKPNDIIISCSGTIGKISIIEENDPIGIINQALLILRFDLKQVDVKFIKYYFECFTNLIVSSSGGAIINIQKREVIEKIKIPIPPIEKQKKIVAILDKFNTLTNSISEGLPKEIELREKQYRYYLNLLLNFKK